MPRRAGQGGDGLPGYHYHTPDWDRARLDIVNGLILMASKAETEWQATFVLRAARDAQEAGLLSPEEARDITFIAEVRLETLRQQG